MRIDRGGGNGDSEVVELAYSYSLAGSGLVAAGICFLLAVGGSGCRGTADPAVHSEWSVPEALPGAEPFGEELRARLERALQEMPVDYRPRTHHLRPDGAPTYTNRLILESSPYLLQHAHNPVNWYPWGEEAFAAARRLGRPILLSVGYSTCHWCHVMERESFEDEEIAAFINANYIAVKVDREERPDVDRVYMEAVQLISGRGGWPMTVVMTPERVPFFAGTYFPARDGDRGARVGFLTILRRLSAHYREHPDDIAARAAALSQKMREESEPEPAPGVPGPAVIARTVSVLARGFDAEHGGFGGAPKFPRPVTLELLLRYHRRSGDERALEMARTTLEAMARGGIHDQIGGGFHRYSTDERWLVPHFEKMLYDNAQLAMAYLDAYQVTGSREFAEVARRTLEYASREMSGDAGEFYSATDADSPTPSGTHEEGWYFTWTPDEIAAVLDRDASELVRTYYGVTERGNFEGRNILSIVRPLAEVAADLGITVDEARERLERARAALYRARLERPAPGTDDKAVAAWNGLMISALARGAVVLGEHRFRERALEAGRFVVTHMMDGGGRLVRSWKAGRAGPPAVLDDYAFVAAGLLDLFEATGDRTWLERAVALHGQLADRFWDGSAGGYFFTAADAEELLVRDKPSYDGAEPSGNSVAVADLLRLYEWTGRSRYREMAEKALAYFAREMGARGVAVPKMLCALDAYLDKTKEIILVAPKGGAGLGPFLERLRATYLPNRILLVTTEDEVRDLASIVPLVEDKRARGGKATAYVCEDRVCELPTTDPQTFAEQLKKVHAYGD